MRFLDRGSWCRLSVHSNGGLVSTVVLKEESVSFEGEKRVRSSVDSLIPTI